MKNNDHTTIPKNSQTTNQQKKNNQQRFISSKDTSRNAIQSKDRAIRQHITASIATLRLPPLKPKLLIEIQQQIGGNEFNDKFVQSIQQIVDCIEYQYPVQFNKQSFDANESLADVLIKIVNNFNTIKHPKSACDFIKDDNGNWYIQEYRTMSGLSNGCHIPLSLVEEIKSLDFIFSNILLKLFQYLHANFGFNIMGQHDEYGHNDYVFEHLHEQLSDIDIPQEERDEIKYWIAQHKTGLVAKYEQLIQQPCIGLDKIIALSSEYIKSKRCKESGIKFHDWLVRFNSFIETEGTYNLQQFRYNPNDPEHMDGLPIMFNDLFGFYWNQEDIIFQQIDNYIEMQANECGVVDPCWYRIWKHNYNFGTIQDHDWPITFAHFFEEFNSTIKFLIVKDYELNKSKY